jgi:hypothetical protein
VSGAARVWLAAALLAGPGPRAGAEWASLAGSGLLTLPDTATLPAGRPRLVVFLDNRDRDPIQLDQIDFSLGLSLGVSASAEAYGQLVLSRAVAIGDRLALFPPPLDLLLPEGVRPPPRPYSPLHAPIPYVNRLGSGQLRRFVPGDAVLGAKLRFRGAGGAWPALAASAELKLPLAKDVAKLQSGAGTGGLDVLGRLTAEWHASPWQLVAAASFQRVGAPRLGDRLITYRASGEVAVADQPLRLPDRIEAGLGARRALKPSLALVAELVKAAEVGDRTPVMPAPGPLDALVGAQLRRGRAQLTLAARYHLNSIDPGSASWSLGGLADVSRVSDADLEAYLQSIGAGAAFPYFRERSQRALVYPPGGPPLPPGTLLLPAEYALKPHGRLGFMILFAWTLGTKP